MKEENKNTDKFYIILTAIILSLVLFFSMFFIFSKNGIYNTLFSDNNTLPFTNAADKNTYPLSVHFIDVGQGDCTLIICRDKAMLIDTGGQEAFLKVDSYLKAQGINEIEWLVATHADEDHIGAGADIMKQYKVNNILMNKISNNTDSFANFISAVSKEKAKIFKPVVNDIYSMADLSFRVIAPIKEYKDSTNNSSIVIKLQYGHKSFIFQGDAELLEERDIINSNADISADVIKIGHHGSNNSSSEEYLKKVNPYIAVISAGLNNSYNLPSEKLLKRLEEFEIDYKRTDTDGNICIATDGEKLFLHLEKK